MPPKERLLHRLVNNGVIAVISQVPQDKIIQVADSLIKGGVTALEIRVENPHSFSSINRLSAVEIDNNLVDPLAISHSNYNKITYLAQQYTSVIKMARAIGVAQI